MRLLMVELDRFGSRRAIALVLLLAALLTALLVATAAWDTRPASDAELAAAEAQLATATEDPVLKQSQEQCAENPEDFFGPGATLDDCQRSLTPRQEDFLPRNTLDLSLMVENRGMVEVVLVSALLVICGATFAGGDWASSSLVNQLLFRPRRMEVWLTKAAAVSLASLVSAVVLVGAFWVALLLVAQVRDIETATPVLRDIAWSSVRGVLLAAAGALGGFALTMLLRSTVATLAVLFAYVVGGEALLLTLPFEKASQWSLANNALAWVNNGTRVFDADIACTPGRGGCDQSYVLGIGHGAAYLGTLLVVTVVLSLLSFRRRDVD